MHRGNWRQGENTPVAEGDRSGDMLLWNWRRSLRALLAPFRYARGQLLGELASILLSTA